jgi:hypothetical protein
MTSAIFSTSALHTTCSASAREEAALKAALHEIFVAVDEEIDAASAARKRCTNFASVDQNGRIVGVMRMPVMGCPLQLDNLPSMAA